MTTPTVSVADLSPLCRSGQRLTIIDVRAPGEFARVHAVGAVLVPLNQFDPGAVGKLRKGPKEPIYVICHSGVRAAKACRMLAEAGVGPALCIEGGTVAWERAGLPVERGAIRPALPQRQMSVAAGVLVLTGLLLAWLVHPGFLGLTAIVGASLVFASLTACCGVGLPLAKVPQKQPTSSAPRGCAPAESCERAEPF